MIEMIDTSNRIRVLPLGEICASQWDKYVLNHPKGSVFHTSAMQRALAVVPKHFPIALAAVDDADQIVAMLSATRIETISGIASRLASRCIWFAEPLCHDSSEGRLALETLVQQHDQVLKGRILFSEIRPLLDEQGERTVLENQGFEFKDYLNYVVDTTSDSETAMSRLGKSARKKIRQSFKRGVHVILENTHEGIERMYRLVTESYRRSQIPLADIALFHAAMEELGDSIVQVRVATHGGEDVAGGISLVYKDRFFAWYGGSIRPQGIVPFDCLTWDEIQWCTENGIAKYDFGGAGWPDEEYGPRDFKAKFGGELTHFGRYRKIYSPLKMRIAEAGFKTLRRFVSPGSGS